MGRFGLGIYVTNTWLINQLFSYYLFFKLYGYKLELENLAFLRLASKAFPIGTQI